MLKIKFYSRLIVRGNSVDDACKTVKKIMKTDGFRRPVSELVHPEEGWIDKNGNFNGVTEYDYLEMAWAGSAILKSYSVSGGNDYIMAKGYPGKKYNAKCPWKKPPTQAEIDEVKRNNLELRMMIESDFKVSSGLYCVYLTERWEFSEFQFFYDDYDYCSCSYPCECDFENDSKTQELFNEFMEYYPLFEEVEKNQNNSSLRAMVHDCISEKCDWILDNSPGYNSKICKGGSSIGRC